MLIGDTEANGLLDTVTKIWCACFEDLETGQKWDFTPDTVHKIPALLDKYDMICGHNFVGYDLPLYEKIFGYKYKGKVFDTLLASRILWPDLEGKAPHSVESWAKRFGMYKVEIDDWSYYGPDKSIRCNTDKEIQIKIYKRIIKHLEKLAIRDSRITLDRFISILHMERRVCETLDEQAANGWYLDVKKCQELINMLSPQIVETEQALIPKLPPVYENKWKRKPVMKPFKQDGTFNSRVMNYVPEDRLHEVAGEFCRIQFRPMKLNDYNYLKNWLLSIGWIPANWNYKKDRFNKPMKDANGKLIKTSPKLPKGDEWDSVAELAKNDDLKLISHYNKLNHRRNVITGLIDNVRGDCRVPAGGTNPQTNTQRVGHRVVVNIPRAEGTFLGQEMRSLFIAAPGKILVGCDAKSLEARILAHYLWKYDQRLAETLISGDIHEINKEKYAEFNITTRNIAKGLLYELVYGAWIPKLMLLHNLTEQQALKLYHKFWKEHPAILTFKEDIKKEYKKFKYILGIDGRPLTVRYEHALLNTLIQSAGAIIMKLGYCIFAKRVKDLGLDCKLVGFFHDEYDSETTPELGEQIGQLKAWSMEEAGRQFKLNVPILGDYKIGMSWAEVH